MVPKRRCPQSIGVLAALIVELENNPEEPHLTRDSSTFEALQCLAEHAPAIPAEIQQIIRRASTSDRALHEIEGVLVRDPNYRALLSTTQAVTVVGGGVKVNALPEQAWALLNHRIATFDSVTALQQRIKNIAARVAYNFDASLVAFGEEIPTGHGSHVVVMNISTAFDSALEPAPRTPTGHNAAPYKLLSGTIRAAFHARGVSDVIVAPGMLPGNTGPSIDPSIMKAILMPLLF